MFLEIVTPEASIVTAEVNSITVPGINGRFQMLKNHASVVSLLEKGTVTFTGSPTITEGFEDRFTKDRSEEHTSELQSRGHLVCRLLLEKKNNDKKRQVYT